MSSEQLFPLLNQSVTSDYSGKVPVEHLDYSFIEKCKDVKYLEKILRVLRWGEEGIYPHLIQFCESHLEKLDPRSRALRKEGPVATAASFSEEEWREITDDLKRWQKETKETETSLRQQSIFDDIVNENMPPVRGSSCSVPLSQNSTPKQKKNSSKHPVPCDDRDWDKSDVEKKCDRIEESMPQNELPANINTMHHKIKTTVNARSLMPQEKLILATREKEKGNEAFRAKDYEEAVVYYSRSLSIMPTVAAFNNRAQTYINLKQWHSAIGDCQRVLELEPGNLKAMLRRANVHKQMGNFQMAAADLRTMLSEEPQNAAARKLQTEVEEKMRKQVIRNQSKAKKIFIQEIEEDDNSCDVKEKIACPVERSRPVGGEESAAAPAKRGDMGNTQKKPHGRGSGGPHCETSSSEHGQWRSKGDKYRVPQNTANGAGKKSSASAQNDHLHSNNKEVPPAGGNTGETVNLDAPCGALPPPLARLKNEGNLLFKNGQFADALEKYSKAIQGFTDSGLDSPEDLSILYSNRAACYLKDGNSLDCIQDCSRALELQPFSLKPLLRRAMAYESLERYRKAYVDYKTVLQIDSSVQAALDSVNRITRLLIEQDGPEWREKLPEIPAVPLSAQRHRREEPASAHVLQAQTEKNTRDAERKAEVRFAALKQEGNNFVKTSRYEDAVRKYNECLKLKAEECAIYTNRALCYLKLERFTEAKEDCDAALSLEPTNKKAFYRRALAHKGLKDYAACSSDLQEVLRQDPNVQEAERELEEVMLLLRQSLTKSRKVVPVTEIEGEEESTAVLNSDSGCTTDGITINFQPTNAYEFGQVLNAARCRGDTAACADLLASTAPEMLPRFLSTQMDGHTVGFIVQALDSHLLQKDPNLVYQHLNHLHTTNRFSVALMLLEKDERHHVSRLFDRLSAVESTEFSQNDVHNLANKYI
ncbi:sperm-associated antigen 1 [Thalassophryne amazonica]|uniref:sperm-associated antigen 1 n=1 Tax=Thalassophryne amazonica TaxID=390379 RepID=UPI0014724A84|nr:sperm-associated antigen 1 [Thalassophryne amazonica]